MRLYRNISEDPIIVSGMDERIDKKIHPGECFWGDISYQKFINNGCLATKNENITTKTLYVVTDDIVDVSPPDDIPPPPPVPKPFDRKIFYQMPSFLYPENTKPIEFKKLATNGSTYIGIKKNNQIVKWGSDEYSLISTFPEEYTPEQIKKIKLGVSHGFLILNDGSIVGWGNNEFKQCDCPSLNGLKVLDVVCGEQHSLALLEDGNLIAWGNNDIGQGSVPEKVGRCRAIACGGNFNLAIKMDRSLVAWGANEEGQCNVPKEKKYNKIAAGYYHAAAITEKREIISWGIHAKGQMYSCGQVTNTPSENDFIDIKCGYFHTIALKENGEIVVWGAGTKDAPEEDPNYGQSSPTETIANSIVTEIYAGQFNSGVIFDNRNAEIFGLNDYEQINIPSEQVGIGEPIILSTVSSGGNQNVGIRKDGILEAWGNNSHGQLNVDAIPQGETRFKSICCGGKHTLALLTDKTMRGWGSGSPNSFEFNYGQCVPPGEFDITQMACGSFHSMVLKEDGTVLCFGDNSHNQCLPPETNKKIIRIECGYDHSMWIDEEQMLFAWGKNDYSQCDIPEKIKKSKIKLMAGGRNHSIAITSSGDIEAWGDNSYEQCEIPNNLSHIKKIVCGENHTVALRNNGTVIAWGRNTDGQCDIHQNINGIIDIAAGDNHTLLLKHNGDIQIFGNNMDGQSFCPTETIIPQYNYTPTKKTWNQPHRFMRNTKTQESCLGQKKQEIIYASNTKPGDFIIKRFYFYTDINNPKKPTHVIEKIDTYRTRKEKLSWMTLPNNFYTMGILEQKNQLMAGT